MELTRVFKHLLVIMYPPFEEICHMIFKYKSASELSSHEANVAILNVITFLTLITDLFNPLEHPHISLALHMLREYKCVPKCDTLINLTGLPINILSLQD